MAHIDPCSLKISSDFSKYPGGRLKIHGPFSGEQLREDHLMPLLDKCDVVIIDLSDTRGYGSSFLDEAFGELGKRLGLAESERRLKFLSDDDPLLIEIVWEKIRKASNS
jgi:hypothetical protein